MSATWYVNGQRLDTLGFRPTPAPAGRRAALEIERPMLTLPGLAGEIPAGTPPSARARLVTIPGVVRGSALSDALERARQVVAVCRRGVVALRCVDATDRVIAAELDGQLIVEAAQPALASQQQWVSLTLRFRAAEPYWQDTVPQLLAVGPTAVACPLGAAPAPWTLEIFGSAAGVVSDPEVRYKDAAGNTVATLTLDGDLDWSTDATARWRLSTEGLVPRIRKMVAGAWTDADSALVGGAFFALSPLDGDPAAGAYPTLELSDAAGRATGVLTYARRHEL